MAVMYLASIKLLHSSSVILVLKNHANRFMIFHRHPHSRSYVYDKELDITKWLRISITVLIYG